MKHKFILIWLEHPYVGHKANTYTGRGFDNPEDLDKHEAVCFKDAFIIVNGTAYDTKDINQAIADSEA